MASSSVPTPPEVDATLTRLTAHKNVQGVLILSRPNGIILRSAGSLFALPPASTAPATRGDADAGVDGTQEEGDEQGAATTSELARKYAKAALSMVEAVGSEVRGVDEDAADDLRFLRVRTRRHELMITPDVQYVLIVVQDPTH
ncbi:hypothetical protein JCM21900_005433 [Sporobolomyces salmonicolor]